MNMMIATGPPHAMGPPAVRMSEKSKGYISAGTSATLGGLNDVNIGTDQAAAGPPSTFTV